MLLPTAGHSERMVYEMALSKEDYIKIGKRIKQYRTEKGISQEALSDMININYRHISNIENGRRYPSLEIIVAFANAFDVSADDLLVDTLNRTSSVVGKEVHAILQDCHPAKKEMLIKILKFIKELLTEYKI